MQNWWGQALLSLPFTWEISPYVWDLGARVEMTERLREWVRLEALPTAPARLNDPYLLIGTTDILNGVSVAIRRDGVVMTRPRQKVALDREPLGYEDIIASCAIPPLYKDVRRRGTAFWDGLSASTPPINALTNLEPRPEEIWIIQINPQRTDHVPESMRDILDCRNELSGNVSLNKELDMIETVNSLLAKGHLDNTHYAPITIRIVGIREGGAWLGAGPGFEVQPRPAVPGRPVRPRTQASHRLPRGWVHPRRVHGSSHACIADRLNGSHDFYRLMPKGPDPTRP